MTSQEREAMEMALDALEHLQTDIEWQYKSPTRAMLRKVEKALRAALATEQEPVTKMREMLEVQGQDGTWNYDPYFHGMYNGMEFMLAMVESREPVFRSSPVKWLGYTAPPQREFIGLTDQDVKDIVFVERSWSDAVRKVEAKLREKNT